MELIRNGIRVEFEDLGEGLAGDYNEDDPNDIPLLRFYISRMENGEWIPIENATLCTAMPVDTDPDIQRQALEFIYDRVHDSIESDKPIKRICQDLSWIEPERFMKI